MSALTAWLGAAHAADPAIGAFPVSRGLCVHLGAVDGERTVAVAEAGEMVVHALGTNADAVARAVRAAGLDGRVSVEHWDLPRLPYSDRSADLVVAEDGCGVPEKEIRRVLTPGGQALIAKGNGWRTVKGEPAAGADNWTHIRRAADANPVSRDTALENVTLEAPDRLRWINDTTVIWPHVLRVAGDRVFLIRMLRAKDDGGAQKTPDQAHVKCRSAWNGILLWEGFFPDIGPSESRRRQIATPERLYMFDKSILSVDAATGKEIARSPIRPFEILAPDDGKAGIVVARTSNTVVGLDAATLTEKWSVKSDMPDSAVGKGVRGGPRAWSVCTVVSDGKHAYTVGQVGTNLGVIAVALKNGASRSIGEGFDLGREAYPVLVSEGVLVVAGKGYVAGIPTAGGDAPWKLAVGTVTRSKDGKTLRSDVDVPAHAMLCSMAHEGRLWLRDSLGMVFGDAPPQENPPRMVGWTGIDLRRGVPVGQIGYPTDRPWGGIDVPENALGQYVAKLTHASGRNWSNRCYADIAFPKAILSQTTEIVGFDGSDPLHLRGVRGQCGIGYALGAGAMITPPNQCIGCYPMVRGMIAYEPRAATGALPIEDGERLVRGPAYGVQPAAAGGRAGASWPMYRRDPMRTGCSPDAVAADGLVELWAVPTPGRCTQAVIADGTVLVAAIDSGRIVALDAASGARRWETGLPSRVDTAPTLHGGIAFVGCHDGRVYALSLADGRCVWRFTAAPMERRIVSGDRVESPWPVMGAVLVFDGAVHATAGHHTSLDGGLQMWGLDPATGAVRYKRVFSGIKGPEASILPTHWYKHEEVALNNVFLGGTIGDTPIVRLYDEWGGWDFKSADGALLRQHKAVPQPGWPKGRVSPGEVTPDDRWPWVGHDRVTAANLLRGLPITYANTLETDPRTRFSGAMGHIFLCPRPGATSILLNAKGGKTRIDPEPWVVPADPKVYSEPKAFAEHAERKAADTWAPVTFPLEAAGAMITGEKVLWLAGKAWVEPSTNVIAAIAPAPSGTMVAVSIADGSQLGKWDFVGGVTFEGLSAAGGRVYLAQDDGTVRCFGPVR
jgi:outer membrane protein assembly factor BamB/SAM-dependent methyltransferase